MLILDSSYRALRPAGVGAAASAADALLLQTWAFGNKAHLLSFTGTFLTHHDRRPIKAATVTSRAIKLGMTRQTVRGTQRSYILWHSPRGDLAVGELLGEGSVRIYPDSLTLTPSPNEAELVADLDRLWHHQERTTPLPFQGIGSLDHQPSRVDMPAWLPNRKCDRSTERALLDLATMLRTMLSFEQAAGRAPAVRDPRIVFFMGLAHRAPDGSVGAQDARVAIFAAGQRPKHDIPIIPSGHPLCLQARAHMMALPGARVPTSANIFYDEVSRWKQANVVRPHGPWLQPWTYGWTLPAPTLSHHTLLATRARWDRIVVDHV